MGRVYTEKCQRRWWRSDVRSRRATATYISKIPIYDVHFEDEGRRPLLPTGLRRKLGRAQATSHSSFLNRPMSMARIGVDPCLSRGCWEKFGTKSYACAPLSAQWRRQTQLLSSSERIKVAQKTVGLAERSAKAARHVIAAGPKTGTPTSTRLSPEVAPVRVRQHHGSQGWSTNFSGQDLLHIQSSRSSHACIPGFLLDLATAEGRGNLVGSTCNTSPDNVLLQPV